MFYLLEGVQNLGFAFQNFCFTTYDLTEVRTMLAETVKGWEAQWKAEGFAEGVAKGRQEAWQKGWQEGMEQIKLDIAQTMLLKGFDKQLIMEVTGLSEEVIAHLAH